MISYGVEAETCASPRRRSPTETEDRCALSRPLRASLIWFGFRRRGLTQAAVRRRQGARGTSPLCRRVTQGVSLRLGWFSCGHGPRGRSARRHCPPRASPSRARDSGLLRGRARGMTYDRRAVLAWPHLHDPAERPLRALPVASGSAWPCPWPAPPASPAGPAPRACSAASASSSRAAMRATRSVPRSSWGSWPRWTAGPRWPSGRRAIWCPRTARPPRSPR